MRIESLARKIRSIVVPKRHSDGGYVNTPIRFIDQEWHVNERIVELPFVYSNLAADGYGHQVLEFGCSQSLLAIRLASMGYTVTGVDLRAYPFVHPNFTFYQGNIIDFEASETFDYIASVSVIEHIGLGAYLEEKSEDDLALIVAKLYSLLSPTGKLIMTVPVGIPHVNQFFRSFARAELTQLFSSAGFVQETARYYCRTEPKVWIPCEAETIDSVSNLRRANVVTGVNGVGCYVWRKQS